MKKEYLFGVVGFLAGAIVAGVIVYSVFAKDTSSSNISAITSSNGIHVMPDGSTMNNMQNGMTMDDMTESLKNKKGEEFDIEFINQMIVHHQGAIDMAELADKNAKHQEIKDLSIGIIEAQKAEIETMKSWLIEWK